MKPERTREDLAEARSAAARFSAVSTKDCLLLCYLYSLSIQTHKNEILKDFAQIFMQYSSLFLPSHSILHNIYSLKVLLNVSKQPRPATEVSGFSF